MVINKESIVLNRTLEGHLLTHHRSLAADPVALIVKLVVCERLLHSLTAEVLALQHLDGDRRLTRGMDCQLLTLATAIEPLVRDGDIVNAVIVVVTETVKRVALNVVGPVVFGVDAAVSCDLQG